MHNSNQALNIVLLPPIDVAKEAMRLSTLISKKYRMEFILDGKNKYPHLTLYQIEIPRANFKKVSGKLHDLLQKQRKIVSRITGIVNEGTFISFDFQKNPRLYQLHKKVVNNLESLREGIKVAIVLKAFKKFTSSQESDLEKYGSLGVMENFRPHITLTRLKSGYDVNAVLRLLVLKEFRSIVFKEVAVGRLSDNGTVVSIVEKYRLS